MTHKGTVIIETPRLILRKFKPEDAPAAFENWCSDPKVTEFLTWPPHKSPEVTQAVIGSWVTGSEKPDFYQWAIVLRELGQPIGSISVVGMDESTDQVEIGYCIGSRWWHRGIVSEAFSALIPFFFEEVGANRIQARHATANPHSGMVMRKCGLSYEGTLRQANRCNSGVTDICVYSILRSEYNERKLAAVENSGSDLCVPLDGGLVNIRVGAIIMKNGRFLMVSNGRLGYLYSVGGRIKFGESAEEAVVREVFEETGVQLEVDRLGFVHECFFKGDTPSRLGKTIYEISFFFYMKTPEDFEPVCGSFTEEGAEEFLTWATPDDPRPYFPEFFRSELKNPSENVKYFATDDRCKGEKP